MLTKTLIHHQIEEGDYHSNPYLDEDDYSDYNNSIDNNSDWYE